MAPLTEPAVGPNRCDVLLIELWGERKLRDLVAMSLPEASFVVVWRSGDRREDPLRARAVARRTNAGGVVVVGAGYDHQLEWLRTLLRAIGTAP